MNKLYSRYYTYIKPVIGNKFVRSSYPFIFNFIAITIFVVFAIRPTITTILNLQKNIEESGKVLDTLNQKAENLVAGKRNLESIPAEKKVKINLALPQKADVTTLITSLKISSSGSDSAIQIQPLTIINTTADQEKSKFNLSEVMFSYNEQGSYPQLMSTLHNLNESLRLITITNTMLNKQSDKPPVLLITGKAYFLN